MQRAHADGTPHRLARSLSWRRLSVTLAFSLALGLLLIPGWNSSMASLFGRTVGLGLTALLAFAGFEAWPVRLPAWLARWVLQVAAVALAMPLMATIIYLASTEAGAAPFWMDRDRLEGFATLSVLGVLFAPWVALGALVRQKDAFARRQALVFDLERSELERQALETRLHLMQAQVAPHFLFNTLANVQALVNSGSPRAPALLGHLIAYLRAAVPRLNDPATTVGEEMDLVRAYLELMHMRMPDRLAFALHMDEASRTLCCPPLTVLTLVENAVRHGIDPSEDGGRIDVHARRDGAQCVVRVADTGLGLSATTQGAGTGLATLRERLDLAFDGRARLEMHAGTAGGVVAEATFPAREVAIP